MLCPMTDAPIYIVPNSIYIPIKVDNITRLFESKERGEITIPKTRE